MVGSLGAYATASVSISNSVVFLLNGVIMALGVGVTALISQSVGAGDTDMTKKLTRHAVLILLYLGVPIAIILGGLNRMIPLWMGADADIIDYAASYNLIVAFGRPFGIASMLLFSAFRGCGDTKTPLRINIGVNVINVIGNYFLIYPTRTISLFGKSFTMIGAGWGVNGAAVATAVAMGVGGICAILLLYCKKKDAPMHIPAGQLPAGYARCRAHFQDQHSRHAGTRLHVGRERCNQPLHREPWHDLNRRQHGLCYGGVDRVHAGLRFCSRLHDACRAVAWREKPELADRYMKVCVLASMAVMTVAGALLFFFGKHVVKLFSNDMEVIALATQCLQIAAILQPAQTGAMVYAGGLRGAGDTLWPMIITASGMWFFRALLGAIVCIQILGYGLPAAVTCMVIDSYVRIVLFYLRVRPASGRTPQSGRTRKRSARDVFPVHSGASIRAYRRNPRDLRTFRRQKYVHTRVYL